MTKEAEGALKALKADGDLYTKHDTVKLFSKYVSDTETAFANDFSQLPKAKQKTKLLETYQRSWTSKVVRSSKGSAYFIFKKTITYEPYLLDTGNTESVIQNSG